MVKPDTCKGCSLYEKGESYVRGEGPLNGRLFLIGEAPGENEARRGLPFCGGAGRVLNALLAESGAFRTECYVTNVVKCRPPGNNLNPFLPQAALHCRQYLDRELASTAGVNTVLLGDVALRFTLGRRSITKHRGCVYRWEGRLVLPTIHPAALMREQKNWPVVVSDLKHALVMDKATQPTNIFIVEPTIDQVREFIANIPLNMPVFIDIETYGNALACIGIARNESEALCIPFWDRGSMYWSDEYGLEVTEMVRHLLAAEDVPKVFHNGMFDIGVLESFGFEINGWFADTMLMHHTVYSEARHSLGFLHSVYVRGEYYKDMHHSVKEDMEE